MSWISIGELFYSSHAVDAHKVGGKDTRWTVTDGKKKRWAKEKKKIRKDIYEETHSHTRVCIYICMQENRETKKKIEEEEEKLDIIIFSSSFQEPRE